MNYQDYASRVPEGMLELCLDHDNEGDQHLCELAEELPEDWDIQLAPALRLKARAVKDILRKYRDEPARQRYDHEGGYM